MSEANSNHVDAAVDQEVANNRSRTTFDTKCPYCEQYFRDADALTQHVVMRHTGRKSRSHVPGAKDKTDEEKST